MKLLLTSENFDQLFDASKRVAELERARQETLRRGRELRRRSLLRQQEKQVNACD